MDFRLKVFQSVARNESFTKASKDLLISQPAISKHIHELELRFNTPLFKRKNGGISITDAGKLLLTHTDKIMDDYRQMEFEMNILTDVFSGELKIGASTTISQYILPPVLADFIKKFPNIKVSLINGNSRDIENALRTGEIKLGMVEGDYHDSSLHYESFMDDELVVVTNVNSSYAKYDELSINEIIKLPLVLRENGSGTLDVFKSAIEKHNSKLSDLNILIQLGSTESIKLFLENSNSIGIISIRGVAKELYSNKLKVIEIKDFKMSREFSFVRTQGTNGGLEEKFILFSSNFFRINI